jgi:hypothetical protein
MKNPLVWLYKKPESMMYIVLSAVEACLTVDFISDHQHSGFVYYLQLFMGCIYIGAFLYFIYTYNFRKYHRIIFMITCNLWLTTMLYSKLAFMEQEGFGYYFRIVVIGLLTFSLIHTLIKHQKYINK